MLTNLINNMYSSLTNPLGLGQKSKNKSPLEESFDVVVKTFAALETPFVIDSQRVIKSQISGEVLEIDAAMNLAAKSIFENLSTRDQMSIEALSVSTNYRFGRLSATKKIDRITYYKLKTSHEKWLQTLALDAKRIVNAETLGKYNTALLTLCKYPDMANLILKNETLADSFFTWCMLAKGDAESWILYNHTVREIQKCIYLDGRLKISKLTPKVERSDDSSGIKGDLKLFLNGKNISLLNPNDEIPAIINQKAITVQEMFDTFSSKLNSHEMELIGGQLKRGNTKRIQADFKKANWFYDLEPYKVMTKEKFELKFFQGKTLPSNYAAVISVGTNGFQVNELKEKNNHAFLILAVPDPKNKGSYLLLQFGATLDEFPSTNDAGQKLASEYGRGCVARDDGVYALKRHKSFFSVGVSMEDPRFKAFLEDLTHDIMEASNGQLKFNLYHRNFNCSGKVAQWMRHFVEGAHLLFAVNYRELSGTKKVQNILFRSFMYTGYVSQSLEKKMIRFVGTKGLGISPQIFEFSSWGSKGDGKYQGYGTHPGKQRKLLANGIIPSDVILMEGERFSLHDWVRLEYNWERMDDQESNQEPNDPESNWELIDEVDQDLDQHLKKSFQDGQSDSQFDTKSTDGYQSEFEGSVLNSSIDSYRLGGSSGSRSSSFLEGSIDSSLTNFDALSFSDSNNLHTSKIT